MTCPDCERHKLSASLWRNKAYEVSGTPLPWNPEELLRKEYERGRAAGAAAERKEILAFASSEAFNRQHGERSPYAYELANAIRARGEAK